MIIDIPTIMTSSNGKTITIRMRNGKTIQGKLKDFDVYMNLTLDDTRDIIDKEKFTSLGSVLIRGDNIISVSVPK